MNIKDFERMAKIFGFTLEVLPFNNRTYNVYFVEQMNPISSDSIKDHNDVFLMKCMFQHWIEQRESIHA